MTVGKVCSYVLTKLILSIHLPHQISSYWPSHKLVILMSHHLELCISVTSIFGSTNCDDSLNEKEIIMGTSCF